MREEYQEALEGFIREGDVDDIGLWEISAEISKIIGVNDFKLSASDTEKLLDAISEFVGIMLQNGFKAKSVELVDGKKEFVTWPEQTPAYVNARIRNEWARLKGEKPYVNFIVYFEKIDRHPPARYRRKPL